ncbi:MAG: HAD family hydrolase [Candidatus Taylorbacteria bacterium]|nr:HAD family hydrolase [Candidatus Taylorbacteria bacterium]
MKKHFVPKTESTIKAVLFDIDGVLLDSFEAGFLFFGDILTALGYPRPTRGAYKSAFHLPLTLALKYLAKADLTEELGRLDEILQNVSYHTELLSEPPGCKEVLEALHKKYKLGIITSRNRDGLSKRYFPFSKTEKYFSVTVTIEDVTHPKPHPEPLLLAAKRLKLKPSECVYVGDSHTDIEAGKSAGMKTILYGGKKHKKADVSIRSFRRLPEAILLLQKRGR